MSTLACPRPIRAMRVKRKGALYEVVSVSRDVKHAWCLCDAGQNSVSALTSRPGS